MATDVKRYNRKRKSHLRFEVDDGDCSPSSSLAPIAGCASWSVSKTDASLKASTDIYKTVVGDDFKQTKSDVDLRCMDMEVDSSSPSPPDMDKPFVTLIFRDKNTANRHKYQIIHFIKSMVNFTLNEESESDLKVNLWEDSYHYDTTANHCINTSTFIDTKNVDLFVVDTTPSKNREMLPRYSPNRIIDELDPDIANGKPNKKDKPICRPNTICFNCDGNHSIKDCTETRDYRRITVARNKYLSQAKNLRYHNDEEQRYKHLVPGKISDTLRRALNLRRNELPPYVYGMRTLGYPPGWLNEALIANTKIQMFDIHGCAVNCAKPEKKVIDPDKVVEYPGFNVPLDGFKDEYNYYKCPPYDENHSKKTMVNFVMKMVDPNFENQDQSTNIVRPCIQEPVPSGCVKLDGNSQATESKEPKKNRSESPTLTDLELRKRQLLAELEDGNLNSPQPTVTKNGGKKVRVREIPSPCVKSSAFGTPILKSASPYAQLPDRDKFSRDISQVISFENLPNSTGKYEKISKVISKVRGTVKTGNTTDNDKS